jgi:hypothetical protein
MDGREAAPQMGIAVHHVSFSLHPELVARW